MQPIYGQHIIHTCKVLAWEALQPGDINEEMYKERFYKKKAKFVVYNKPYIYISTSIHINKLHLKCMQYTTVLKDLIKLCRIWKVHGRLYAELRINDEKCTKYLQQRLFAWNLRQGIQGPIRICKEMNGYTKHAWNKNDEAFNLIVHVFFF